VKGDVRGPLPDDLELVQRLRDRDEAAFELVVDAWSSGMLHVARSFVTTDDSASEVLQDTWLAVISGVGSFEARSSLRTWVYRILVNTAKRRGERESRIVPWSSWALEGADEPTVDPSRFQGPAEDYPGHWRAFPQQWPSLEDEALAGETRAVVGAAMERLPMRQRIVMTLRDVEGCSSEEVCTILEISSANQRVLLHRARAAVRAELEEYFTSVDTRADEEVSS
jgi:RNA polymerase sigma-70 factor (ECF subfamily)